MGYGTWISQFNVRSIATPFKDETQSGAPNGEKAVFQAQMLLNPGYSKNYFGKAAEHLKLVVEAYESEKQAPGKQVSGVYSKTLWNLENVIYDLSIVEAFIFAINDPVLCIYMLSFLKGIPGLLFLDQEKADPWPTCYDWSCLLRLVSITGQSGSPAVSN